MSDQPSPLPVARWPDGFVLSVLPGSNNAFQPLEPGQVAMVFTGPEGFTYDVDVNTDSTYFAFSSPMSMSAAVKRRLSWFLSATLPQVALSEVTEFSALLSGLPVPVPPTVAADLAPDGWFDREAERAGSAVSALLKRLIQPLPCSTVRKMTDLEVTNFPVKRTYLRVSWWLGRAWWEVRVDTFPLGTGPTPRDAILDAGFEWPGMEHEWRARNHDPGELLVDVELYLLLGEVPDFWRTA